MDVLLVDENDLPLGREEKLKAHREGKLHRAFSVFIYNKKGDILIHRRAPGKYHSGGLWANACCSHPLTDNIKEEAEKRLEEEMGLSCSLAKKAEFIYIADVGNGMIEHEYDHIFSGVTDMEPNIKNEEADRYIWISPEKLKSGIKKNPEKYAPWLRIIVEKEILEF